VAEDHGLCDSNGSIDVAQSLEFLLLAVADDVVLLDGVQSFLLTLKFNDVGVGNDPLCKVPHSVFKCGREQQHLPPVPRDTNALVLMALCGDHDISFIQDEHLDLPGVDEFKLLAPIQNSTGSRTVQKILTPKIKALTFVSSDGIHQLDFRVKFAHLFDDLTLGTESQSDINTKRAELLPCIYALHSLTLMHFIPEAICFQGPRDLTWPAQRQPFYPCLTETERSDSVDWTGKDMI
uniref:Uncharacterized protein n=1 Tax=Sinocyclocheilus anshuiensis TaxID=1608454 RepID=A0A671NBS4_9TELE